MQLRASRPRPSQTFISPSKQKLTIIPVINKIDLPNADVETVKKQLEDILAIPADEAIEASAKAGLGITEILEALVAPHPAAPAQDETLRGLVFDSVFDGYRGVVAYIRVSTGSVAPGRVRLMSTGQNYEIKEVGVFTPKMLPQPRSTPEMSDTSSPISRAPPTSRSAIP